MEFSENTFRILDTLDTHIITTQRQLSKHAGISLGQVNYVLKTLLEKGLVKLGNFKKNPRKIGYAYLLTPTGIEAKSTLAVKFILSKLKEYRQLRETILKKLSEIEKKAVQRIVFVGPELIYDLLRSVIEEHGLSLILVGSFPTLKELEEHPLNEQDMILLGNDDADDLKKSFKKGDKNRVVNLW